MDAHEVVMQEVERHRVRVVSKLAHYRYAPPVDRGGHASKARRATPPPSVLDAALATQPIDPVITDRIGAAGSG